MSQRQFLGEFEELVLLAILKLGTQAYGVPIAEEIEKATGKRVSTGALYTTLGRLEAKKFISSWLGEKTDERGGRAKKYFEVKNAGREAIRNSAESRIKLFDLVLIQNS
jgi:PadR family transcriptional regulator PadR